MKKLLPLIIGLVLLCKLDAFGVALYCWDTNNTASGAGSATPTGTWGVDPFWGKESWDGTVATEAWTAGNLAIFAAGHDAIHTSNLPAQNRTPDTLVNDCSIREQRVVITKDTDFYHSHLMGQND